MQMPLFSFVLVEDREQREQSDLLDFPDLRVAWPEATVAAGEMLRDCSLKPSAALSFEDEAGNRRARCCG
jgi:hypothetical protein